MMLGDNRRVRRHRPRDAINFAHYGSWDAWIEARLRQSEATEHEKPSHWLGNAWNRFSNAVRLLLANA